MLLAEVFGPSDALVAVAAIGLVGTLATALVNAQRTKKAVALAERAVHNTQPNGAPDPRTGETGPPSAYDSLVASHEYMIGQIHATAEAARHAADQAALARAAVKQNDIITSALAKIVEEGFDNAAAERERIVAMIEQQKEEGARFVDRVVVGALGVLGRLDALDGQTSRSILADEIARRDDESGS